MIGNLCVLVYTITSPFTILSPSLERSRLDPNDPRNAQLLRLIESVPNSADLDVYFRLIDVDDLERFVVDELFENDRRFTLLQLRDQGVSTTYLQSINQCS